MRRLPIAALGFSLKPLQLQLQLHIHIYGRQRDTPINPFLQGLTTTWLLPAPQLRWMNDGLPFLTYQLRYLSAQHTAHRVLLWYFMDITSKLIYIYIHIYIYKYIHIYIYIYILEPESSDSRSRVVVASGNNILVAFCGYCFRLNIVRNDFVFAPSIAAPNNFRTT